MSVATLSGHRARYWFGKRVRSAPGSELGRDAQHREGKVSETRRWFSYDWWFGHNMTRSSAGTWSSFENRGKAPAPAKWAKSTYRARAKTGTNTERARADAKGAYAAYLHARYLAAAKATKEYMVTPAGRAHGYDGESFFAENTSARPGRRWMTDELRAWFGDSDTAQSGKGGGGVLSFTAYQRLSKQERPAAA